MSNKKWLLRVPRVGVIDTWFNLFFYRANYEKSTNHRWSDTLIRLKCLRAVGSAHMQLEIWVHIFTLTHRIHVWYINPNLGDFWWLNIPYMDPMGVTQPIDQFIPRVDIFPIPFQNNAVRDLLKLFPRIYPPWSRGSTKRTLLHEKINPQNWQVINLGDVGFLLLFRVVSGDYGKLCEANTSLLKIHGWKLSFLGRFGRIFRGEFPVSFREWCKKKGVLYGSGR